MSKELSQMKIHLDNLNKNYPGNNITYEEKSDHLNIKVNDAYIELEYEVLSKAYDTFGIKFINSIIDMIRNNMLNIPKLK